MAKRKAKVVDAPTSSDEGLPADTPLNEAVAEVVGHDPNVFVKLGGRYVEHPGAADRERRIDLDGVNYEHVGEDADGVWVYRQM